MSRSVFYIKLIHSILFFLIVVCTLYILYVAIIDKIDVLAWIAFGIVITELAVLVLNDWQCPLTTYAEQQGAASGSVADLFLPEWLSDRLFRIFGILFSITCLLLLWRILG